MPIDFVAQAAAADTTQVVVPCAFDPRALNCFIVVFIATCHTTGGLSSEPVDSVTYAGVTLNRVRGESGTVEIGLVPPRSMMYASTGLPFTSVPLAGDIVVTCNATTHAVVHAVGLRGALPNGFYDTDQGGGSNGVAFLNVTYDDPWFAGVMGVALLGAGNPQTPGSGIAAQLGTTLNAGTGGSAVRGTAWSSLEAANWTVNGEAVAWAATGLQFKGGAADLASPAVRHRGTMAVLGAGSLGHVDLRGGVVGRGAGGLDTVASLHGAIVGASRGRLEDNATAGGRLSSVVAVGALEANAALRGRLPSLAGSGVLETTVTHRGVVAKVRAMGRVEEEG